MARQQPKRNSQPNNVRRFRKPRFTFDLGTIVFGLILFYVLIYLFFYLTESHVSAYEVKSGTITENHSYTGIAIRSEKVFNAESAGNINYYVSEGERVGVKTLVYTIDESGKATELLVQAAEEGNALSSENWKELQTSLYHYTADTYSDMNFSSIYAMKTSLNGSIMEMLNHSLLETLNETSLSGTFKSFRAPESGLIVFSTDGYETLTADSVTLDMFNESAYTKKTFKNSDLVSTQDPAYKLIMDENWSIVIPLEKEQAKRLKDDGYHENYITIKFSKDRTSANAYLTLFEKDGHSFAKLDLTNSVVRFAQDRFIHIELQLKNTEGLKVPNSSILEKEFYTVPKDFVNLNNPSFDACVNLETVDENGNTSVKVAGVTIYKTVDEEYYIDKDSLTAGTSLIMQTNTQERYVVGKTASLTGVYNINKGYAVFRSISVLSSNSEYSIIEPDSKYGLSEYDHIVLDAKAVEAEEIIY